MLIYSKYHHWSYKSMIPLISYETYESLTPSLTDPQFKGTSPFMLRRDSIERKNS